MDSLRTNPNAGGEVDPLPLQVAGGGMAGATDYSGSVARIVGPKGYKLSLTYGTHYTAASWSEKVQRGGVKNVHAFMDNTKKAIDGALAHSGMQLSVEAWGNGGAPLGVVGSINTGTNTVVLSDKETIVNFWEGMPLVDSANDGSDASHTLRDSGRVITVSTVDQAAGSFVYTGTDIASMAANDYLFRAECFAGNVDQNVLMKGLTAWIPYTAPTDTFFGVARTGKGAYVYGYSSSGDTVIESGNAADRIAKLAIAVNSRMGAEPSDCWVHPRQWQNISTSLQQQGIRPIDVKNYTGTWNYKALEMGTAYGTVAVKSDRHCPTNRAYLLSPEYIELRSMGPILSPLDADGLKIRKDPNGINWIVDFATFAQLAIEMPGAQAVCALAAVS
jgi:hypothetical protein